MILSRRTLLGSTLATLIAHHHERPAPSEPPLPKAPPRRLVAQKAQIRLHAGASAGNRHSRFRRHCARPPVALQARRRTRDPAGQSDGPATDPGELGPAHSKCVRRRCAADPKARRARRQLRLFISSRWTPAFSAIAPSSPRTPGTSSGTGSMARSSWMKPSRRRPTPISWPFSPTGSSTPKPRSSLRREAGVSLATLNSKALATEETHRPGSRIRLRLLNASAARLFFVAFENMIPHVLAIDGQPCAAFSPVRQFAADRARRAIRRDVRSAGQARHGASAAARGRHARPAAHGLPDKGQ